MRNLDEVGKQGGGDFLKDLFSKKLFVNCLNYYDLPDFNDEIMQLWEFFMGESINNRWKVNEFLQSLKIVLM